MIHRYNKKNPTTCTISQIVLRWIFKKWDVGAWTGWNWLRIETSGGRFVWRNEPSGYVKCGGISWLAANQLAAQEVLCSMELVS